MAIFCLGREGISQMGSVPIFPSELTRKLAEVCAIIDCLCTTIYLVKTRVICFHIEWRFCNIRAESILLENGSWK